MVEINEHVIELAADAARIGMTTVAETARSLLSAEAASSAAKALAPAREPALDKWVNSAAKMFHEDDPLTLVAAQRDPYQEAVDRGVLSSNLPGGQQVRLLEVGPDFTSTVPYALANRLKSYTAVEISKGSLLSLQKGLRENGVDISRNHVFIHGNGIELPVKSGSQDVVYMNGTTKAFFPWKLGMEQGGPDWTPAVAERALSEASRVLVPGGKLIMRPWSAGMANEVDTATFRQYFSSMDSRGIAAEYVGPIARYSKRPNLIQPGSFQALVLTK